MVLLRHLLAILVLPVTMAVIVPWWIARRADITFVAPSSVPALALVLVGLAAAAIGLALFTSSVLHFATRGRGTLAPWDPPRQLVVSGPYRYVRNPMISGVVFTLIAEACILRSVPHAQWATLFFIINAVYIPLFEEPLLAARFGESYEAYRKNVPRLIPRFRGR